MRIVLDTNILVSALITKATPPDLLYQAWLANDVELKRSGRNLYTSAYAFKILKVAMPSTTQYFRREPPG